MVARSGPNGRNVRRFFFCFRPWLDVVSSLELNLFGHRTHRTAPPFQANPPPIALNSHHVICLCFASSESSHLRVFLRFLGVYYIYVLLVFREIRVAQRDVSSSYMDVVVRCLQYLFIRDSRVSLTPATVRVESEIERQGECKIEAPLLYISCSLVCWSAVFEWLTLGWGEGVFHVLNITALSFVQALYIYIYLSKWRAISLSQIRGLGSVEKARLTKRQGPSRGFGLTSSRPEIN